MKSFFLFLLIFACGEADKTTKSESSTASASKTSKWSDAEKAKARIEVLKGVGDGKDILGEEKTNALVDCIIAKAEEKYDTLAKADVDIPGMEEIGKNCGIEIMTDPNSKKGNWSAADKTQFLNDLNQQRADLEGTFGKEKTEEWIQCAAKKTENTFTNYVLANQGLKEMEKIGADCALEVMK